VSISATLPLAHAGHVLVDLMTVAPVVVLLVWFGFIAIRDRRRGVDEEPPVVEADSKEH
jgi:hypothetical protein